MKIVVTKRTNDIHVCAEVDFSLDEKTNIWAPGKTLDEALGNLLRTHPEHFEVEKIEWDKNDSQTKRYLDKQS
ncbi:hypothetical protein K8R32_01515 [bacterium]|nr:hypothetical protein [bacterium]